MGEQVEKLEGQEPMEGGDATKATQPIAEEESHQEVVEYDYSAVQARLSQMQAGADFKRMLGRSMLIATACIGTAAVFLAAGQGWWLAQRETSVEPTAAVAAPAMDPTPPTRPAFPPTVIERTSDGGVVTTDFTIFRTVEVPTNLGSLEVKAGHHFDTEDQSTFSHAWCYAELGGSVAMTINLGTKDPSAPAMMEPFGETERRLSKLESTSHRRMFEACPWIDANPNLRRQVPDATTETSVQAVGQDVLRLRGVITPAAVEALEDELTGHVRVLELSSPGGRIDAALRAHALVREAGVATVAVSDCASACALIFIAGSERSVGPEGRLGVHQWVSDTGGASEAEAQSLSAELLRLTLESGVSADFFIAASQTPHEDIRWVKGSELEAWGLITQ